MVPRRSYRRKPTREGEAVAGLLLSQLISTSSASRHTLRGFPLGNSAAGKKGRRFVAVDIEGEATGERGWGGRYTCWLLSSEEREKLSSSSAEKLRIPEYQSTYWSTSAPTGAIRFRRVHMRRRAQRRGWQPVTISREQRWLRAVNPTKSAVPPMKCSGFWELPLVFNLADKARKDLGCGVEGWLDHRGDAYKETRYS